MQTQDLIRMLNQYRNSFLFVFLLFISCKENASKYEDVKIKDINSIIETEVKIEKKVTYFYDESSNPKSKSVEKFFIDSTITREIEYWLNGNVCRDIYYINDSFGLCYYFDPKGNVLNIDIGAIVIGNYSREPMFISRPDLEKNDKWHKNISTGIYIRPDGSYEIIEGNLRLGDTYTPILSRDSSWPLDLH